MYQEAADIRDVYLYKKFSVQVGSWYTGGGGDDVRYQVNSGPSEFGTKWTRDQVVNSGPNIFGTRWIRDQTLGEFGTKFFQSYKYVNTGISYLVSNILYSSIVICIFVLTGADPGIFVRGGPTFQKILTSKKKKKK